MQLAVIYILGTHTVVLGTFRKSQKLTPSEKNQSVLIAKISSRTEHKKITNPKKCKLRQKFRATRYSYSKK